MPYSLLFNSAQDYSTNKYMTSSQTRDFTYKHWEQITFKVLEEHTQTRIRT